ncbi:hypothetical protein THMIRHAM_19350 [Thiomicrorhabdus immobilis]|uniref:Tetratricopeptide repeat protein n=1 Tax=Thiomicrorhabdus immobilis TaxID=2791037 RepID=A0ABN6CYE5_9GAMM|nr:tetratricopeptide repeat-containing sulfotransferase family protein [Thiomicrorhabdus immobilis]BCN94150.1 hypothetical protein THMIRHAM_19350 [Thiomicrorhabdus immobilis]
MNLSDLRLLAEQLDFQDFKSQTQSLWIKSESQNVLPLLSLSYIHEGKFALAHKYFKQALNISDSFDNSIKLDLAGVALALHQPEEAKALLQPLLADEPSNAIALARMAQVVRLEGDLESALNMLMKSVALQPNRLISRSNLIALLLELKKLEQAQIEITKFTESFHLNTELSDSAKQRFNKLFHEYQLRLWVLNENFSQAEHWLGNMKVEFILENKENKENLNTPKALIDYFNIVTVYARVLAEYGFFPQASEFLKDTIQDYQLIPDSLVLKLLFVELAELQGNHMQAQIVLEQAIKQNEDNIDLWIKLASIQLAEDSSKAIQATEKAWEILVAKRSEEQVSEDWITLYELKIKSTLASAKLKAEDYASAQELFEEVLAQNPYFVPAIHAYAQQKMQTGQIEEAIELFERLKQWDPVAGYSALINARKFPEDKNTLEKIAQAAQRPFLANDVKSYLLFQLALAWEKRKDYDKAFEFVKQANDTSLKLLKYEPKQHRNYCARIRIAFSKSLYESRGHYGSDSELPVFVVGMPRSGTTLVEQILASHSEIFGAGELGVIPQRIHGLNRWERHVGSGRRYPDIIDDLSAEVTTGIAEGILGEMQAHAPHAKHIVDKLPHNFENIGLIKFLFPNARIISVRRDPRDIAISNYFTNYQAKHGGMGFAYDLTNIGEQLADHNLLMHHWHKVFPDEILEVQYEALVENPEQEARRMLQYIGVEWEDQVLNFNKLDRPVKTASVWQVRQPIYKTAKEKWRHYERYLRPLIKGTNAKIEWDPIEDMITLPEAGIINKAADFYENNQLADAEYEFKKILHHNPSHATANGMIGVIYARANLIHEAIPFMEKAYQQQPWKKYWKENLIRAYEKTNQYDKADEIKASTNEEFTPN